MFLCVCVCVCIVEVSGSPLGQVLRGSVGRVLLGLQMRQSRELHNLLPSAVLELNYLMRVIKNIDRWDWLNAGRGPRRIHIIISVAGSSIYLLIIISILISIACIGCTCKCSVCREVAANRCRWWGGGRWGGSLKLKLNELWKLRKSFASSNEKTSKRANDPKLLSGNDIWAA